MENAPDVPIKEVMTTCAANHSRMAARAVTRAYNQALKPCGLKVTQFTILVALASQTFDSITEMADRLALERSSLSRNVSRLEERDLLRTVKDGRSRHMELTEEGVDKIEEAFPLWRNAQSRIEHNLGADRWTEARALLRSLAKAAE